MKNPWFPTINLKACDGCEGTYKYVSFCPYRVLELKNGKPFVANPLNCIYRCSSCASLCKNGAIIFPARQSMSRSPKKGSSLQRIRCVSCGKEFLADRKRQYCFDCEEKKVYTHINEEHSHQLKSKKL